MKLCVFGATGKTGSLTVEAALDAGHEVTVFARSPSKLTVAQDKVRVVEGDATDAEAVARAIEDCAAIINALGSGNNTLSQFGENLVPAMTKSGVKRVVSLVGAGVEEKGDPNSFGRSIIRTLLKLFAGHVLADASRHADQLRASDLDWTLVRPPRLVDGDSTGEIRHAPSLKLGPADKMIRADLAQFILTLATSDQYVRQSPMVANA